LDLQSLSEVGRITIPVAECQTVRMDVVRLQDGTFYLATNCYFDRTDNLRVFVIDAKFNSKRRLLAKEPIDNVENASFLTPLSSNAAVDSAKTIEELRLITFHSPTGDAVVRALPSLQTIATIPLTNQPQDVQLALVMPEILSKVSADAVTRINSTIGHGFSSWGIAISKVEKDGNRLLFFALDGTLVHSFHSPGVGSYAEFVLPVDAIFRCSQF
jgi:hypothetical protein